MRILSAFLACFFITACGGSDSDVSNNVTSGQSRSSEISLEEFIGTYKLIFEDAPNDEYFVVVRDDGEYIEYDFDGDSFDMGENCYFRFPYDITEIGSNSFEIVDEFDSFKFRLDRIRNGFNATLFEANGESDNFEVIFENSTLLESDFTPEC